MIDRYVSPTELRRLISALLVVLGFIALAALFGFIVVPGLRYQAHAAQESPVQAVQGDTGWLDPTDYPATAKRIIPPINPATVMTPNPELMARGKEVYARTCATCHGPEGRGDGPGGKGLNPVPRDFTHATGWKNGTTLEAIYHTLEVGIKGSSMVAYTDLSRRDRMALAHVVQSLGGFDHGKGDPAALAALAKSFASAGEVIPNHIPVRQAVKRLVAEAPSAPSLGMDSPLVRASIWEPQRASITLENLPGWRTSDQILAKGVLAGLPANGFTSEVAAYSPAQWKELRDALVRK
ncbi:MAG: c-type cytochrome [Firmicutes bacterium]|nr:c-type cytochrome [Bacillota bacterium]